MKLKLSTGADGIPSLIVKGCPVLVHIFNLSVESETFHVAWKISVAVPSQKSSDRSMVNNYRPVSLLCNLSKVYEIVLHIRLYAYFLRNIIPEQHDVMKGRSAETNSYSLLSEIVPSVHSGQQADVLYFDMTKALYIYETFNYC